MTTTATERINLRTTSHAKKVIEQASDLMGVSVSYFVIEHAYNKALEILENSKHIALSPTEWENALKLLDNPPDNNQAMTDLFNRGYRVIHQ